MAPPAFSMRPRSSCSRTRDAELDTGADRELNALEPSLCPGPEVESQRRSRASRVKIVLVLEPERTAAGSAGVFGSATQDVPPGRRRRRPRCRSRSSPVGQPPRDSYPSDRERARSSASSRHAPRASTVPTRIVARTDDCLPCLLGPARRAADSRRGTNAARCPVDSIVVATSIAQPGEIGRVATRSVNSTVIRHPASEPNRPRDPALMNRSTCIDRGMPAWPFHCRCCRRGKARRSVHGWTCSATNRPIAGVYQPIALVVHHECSTRHQRQPARHPVTNTRVAPAARRGVARARSQRRQRLTKCLLVGAPLTQRTVD